MSTNTLPKSVHFQDVDLSIIDHNGTPWLTSVDLARGLEYAEADAVTRIYNRNKDEFTEEMSQTVKLTVNGFGQNSAKKSVRIFSPRGCHLIAMFARTERAKLFRKWVLDVLEEIENKPSLPRPTGLSNSQRREIQQRIAEVFAQEERRAVYDRLKDHFDVARYWNIPCARFEEAMALIESFTPRRKPNREKKVMADKARLEAAIRDLIGFLHLDDNCSHGAFQDRQKIAVFLERALVNGRSSANSMTLQSEIQKPDFRQQQE